MDFGCYGINLMTWLMDNQKPLTVSATTQQLKDDSDYTRVDDEATIVLTYPDAQTIIQGSWNWPFDRKDMELYGETGYIQTIDKNRMRRRFARRNEIEEELEPLATPERDPFPCLTAVVRDGFQPSGLWSLENNLIVMEVLDAARESARTGQRIHL